MDSGGVLTPIRFPGATNGTFPQGINDVGQIVGIYGTVSGNLGFLDTGGVFTTINVPGAVSINPTGINDAGQIVGSYCFEFGQCQSFLDIGGVFTTISVPGASITQVEGINDAGEIVGWDYTPPPSSVPEPGTFILLTTGIIGLAGIRRLRD